MNVNITCTPEFSSDVLKEVVLILNQTAGVLEFNMGRPLNVNQYSLAHPKLKTIKKNDLLNFEDLFALCNTYRTFKEIPDDEYLVIVTSIKNNKDWFSAFQGKDIFIHGIEWEYYTQRDARFGISYQVVENIFQSQIDLNINDVDNEPNIHMESIGCINDMCMNKTDVLLKLRTADICDSCLERTKEKNVNPLILEHINRIIGNLREEFVNSNRIRSMVKPDNVYIDPNRLIKIGNRNVDIPALNKVLFIFFLKNIEGIETKLVCEYQDDLYNIYKEIRDNPDNMSIKRMFESEKGANPTFEIVRSKLNRALVDQLGGRLADFYILETVMIRDGINKYKINLTEEYILIENPKRKH